MDLPIYQDRMMILKRIRLFLLNETILIFIVNVSYFYSGMGRTYIALLIPQLRQPDSTIKITPEEESWIATLNILPKMLGCIFGGVIMDAFGRVFLLRAIPILFIVGWSLLALIPSISIIYVSMICYGLCAGMLSTAMTYVLELSSPHRRGLFTSFTMPIFYFGSLTGNSIVYTIKWRMSAVCFAYLGLVNFLAMFFLPESPSWLVKRSRTDEAVQIMTRLKGNELIAREEIAELETRMRQRDEETSNKGFRAHFVTAVRCWKQMAIIVALYFSLHASGFSAFDYYWAIFVQQLQLPLDPSASVMIYSGVSFVSTIISPLLVHKLSRKSLLIGSELAMAFFMISSLAYQTIFLPSSAAVAVDNIHFFVWIPVVSLYGYVTLLKCGVTTAIVVMSGELFPLEYRGVLTGTVEAIGYVFGTVFVRIFPSVFLYSLGATNTLLYLLAVCLSFALFVKLFVPETSKKTLEEIQTVYFSPKKGKDPKNAKGSSVVGMISTKDAP